MKAACHTDSANHAQSLVKYPFVILKYLNSAVWQHHGDVTMRNLRGTYESHMVRKHNGFEVSDSGLVINPAWGPLQMEQ